MACESLVISILGGYVSYVGTLAGSTLCEVFDQASPIESSSYLGGRL